MTKSLASVRNAAVAALSTVLVLSLSTPAHATAAAAVAAPKITLQVTAAAGSGCAPGTPLVVANSDNSGFRIKYDDFVATTGGGAPVTDRRKNCQIGVLVSFPAGWTFAVAKADYRGRAKLASGATGLQQTSYYWQGDSEGSSTEQTFTGPLNTYWDTTDAAPVLAYAPCGGTQAILNINTELRLNPGTSTSVSTLSMKTSDGDVDTLFNLDWQQC
jgi:hypothetical protein